MMKSLNEDYNIIEFHDPEEVDEVVADMDHKGYYPVGVVDSWPNERGVVVYKQAFKRIGI